MADSPVQNIATWPIDLADGRVLAPGEGGEADLEHPHNLALLEAGHLVESQGTTEKLKAKPPAKPQTKED